MRAFGCSCDDATRDALRKLAWPPPEKERWGEFVPAAAFGGHFLDPDGVTMNSTTPGAGGRPAGRSCVQRAGEERAAAGCSLRLLGDLLRARWRRWASAILALASFSKKKKSSRWLAVLHDKCATANGDSGNKVG